MWGFPENQLFVAQVGQDMELPTCFDLVLHCLFHIVCSQVRGDCSFITEKKPLKAISGKPPHRKNRGGWC
jgi:hypothetical protein